MFKQLILILIFAIWLCSSEDALLREKRQIKPNPCKTMGRFASSAVTGGLALAQSLIGQGKFS